MDPESDEGIAVVGMACRFPGAGDIDEFWKVLVNGENHVTHIPKDRWNNDAFYCSDVNAKGKSYVKSAAFIERLTEWDNQFFQINDDEAARMDPQQYLLLECTYRALENGGFPLDKVAGKNVGCYIGVMNNDYASLLSGDAKERNNYSVTGMTSSIIANRLSYFFNLTGPSLCVDTACSSSLIGTHLACQGLRAGDCDMAICGGVNVLLEPHTFVSLCKSKMLSPTGLSQPFSAQADGYARGEGCGVLILKSLKKAITDGDRIWGIVGTGCNQDGRFATPITAPSSTQQENLLKMVYSKFKVDPSQVDYIEAHGTGTPVGDPVEATALGKFIGKARKSGEPYCFIGSVKSNIGHLESAAGVAGMIKVLLMINNKTIVPTLHFRKPNRQIDFHDLRLEVPVKVVRWEQRKGGRLACVNSFGFGGSNAHAIVREYIDQRQDQPVHHPVVAISAKSKLAMKYTIQHLRNILKNKDVKFIEDLSYTSTVRRMHWNNYRLATCVTSHENLYQALEKAEEVFTHKKSLTIVKNKRLIFVFPGMGTDWRGMGNDLFENESDFREAIVKIDHLLSQYTSRSLVKIIQTGKLASGAMKQIAIFAIEVALHDLWSSWGVLPDAIIGHSVGEVAAAYAAGKLSLETAVKIIFYRSHLLERVSGGKMAAVSNISRDEVDKLCNAADGGVEIAAINSPTSFTLSGDANSIAVIENLIMKENGKGGSEKTFRLIKVDTAFHSQQVQPICSELVTLISPVERPRVGKLVDIYSTVTGHIAKEDDYTSSQYWERNIRQPVEFSQAVEAAIVEDAQNIIIEVGPKPALQRNIAEITNKYTSVVLPSMKENKDYSTMLNTLCQLFELGIHIDWNSYHKHSKRIPIDLPMYQFNRSKHWHEPETSRQRRMGCTQVTRESFCFVSRDSVDGMTYRCSINKRNFPFVLEHRVGGVLVVPGAVYVELALEACFVSLPLRREQNCKLAIEFLKPLVLKEERVIDITLEQNSSDNSTFSFQINDGGISHAIGKIMVYEERKPAAFLDISKVKAQCLESVQVDNVYRFLNTCGFSYGSMMQPISGAWKNGKEALVMLSLPERLLHQLENTVFHPVLLDGVLQATAVTQFDQSVDDNLPKFNFPISIGDVELFRQLNSDVLLVYVRQLHKTGCLVSFNAIVMNESGEVVAEFKNIMTKMLHGKDSRVVSQLTYELEWYGIAEQNTRTRHDKAIDSSRSDVLPQSVIFADNLGVASLLQKSINSHSHFIEFSDANIRNIHNILQNLQGAICTIQHVLYFWSISGEREIATGESFYKHIISVCVSLKHIVKFLSLHGASCRLTVVTLGSQSICMSAKETCCKTREELYSSCGLSGAPLWGMVRCFLHESTYDNTILVDLRKGTKEEVSTLTTLAFATRAFYHSEYAIVGSRVYINRLKRLKLTEDYFKERVVHAQQEVPVNVMSSLPDRLERLELYHGDGVGRFISAPKLVQVCIVKARLHCPEFYYVTNVGLSPMGSLPWQDTSNNQVLIIDSIGKVMSLDSSIPQGTKVHICCPLELCTVSDVPESLIIKSYDLPLGMQDTPCLSSCVLLWEVFVKNVHEYSSKRLIIDGSKRFDHLGKLFLTFASKCGFDEMSDSRSYICHDQTTGDGIQPILFLHLGITPDKVIRWIHKSLPTGSVVVNITNGPSSSLRGLFIVRPDIKIISIDNSYLFQAKRLEIILPKVVEWLQRTTMEGCTEAPNVSEFNFDQCDSSTLVPHCEDESIRVLAMNPKGLVHVEADQLFHRNACYLVVGGTKGLGFELCNYMSAKGAGYIAVLSRYPPTSTKSSELRGLETRGTKVLFLNADVGDEDTLSKALKGLRERLSGIPIKGVFHGAVVLADHLLVNMSDEDFVKATRPKILGAWNLHKLTMNDPLDYFIMHSSIVSVFGNKGQSNYGAGNAFLDHLARHRRQRGLPGQTLNWSVLDIGVIENARETKDMLTSVGYLPLSVNDIVECFDYAIKHNPSQVVFGEFLWSRISRDLMMTERAPQKERFKDFIHETMNVNVKEGGRYSETEVSHDSKQTVMSLRDLVKKNVALVLTVETEEIQDDLSLLQLGLDSIQAMTMQAHLKDDTGVNVPIALLLQDKTTVSTISCYIEENDTHRKIVQQPISYPVKFEADRSSGKVVENQAERFHRTLDNPPDITSNVYATFRVHRSDLTGEHLIEAVRMLMKKHTMLRAKYRLADSAEDMYDVVFDIHENCEPDVRILRRKANEVNVLAEMKQASEIPFDLRNEFPVRFFMKIADNNVTHFSCVVHNISCDFFSLTMLFRDLRNALLSSIETDKSEQFEFGQYLAQRNQLLHSREKSLRGFWEEVFKTPLEFIPGRFSLINRNPISAKGYQVSLDVRSSDSSDLYRFARQSGLTAFQVIIGVYAILLHIHSRSNDVLITYPVDMRIHIPVSRDAIGFFVNAIPLRVSFGDKKMCITDFLKGIGNMVKSGMQHSLYPFPKISQCVKITGDDKPSFLAQHTISWEEYSALQEVGHSDIVDGIENVDGGVANLRCTTFIEAISNTNKNSLSLKFNFNSSCITQDEGTQFSKDYANLLETCIREPHLCLVDIVSKYPTHY
ncbi:phthioceranic/hydroxyphthioceranic acid synthase-like [Ptychodera flava]|uniref:phthioceranic/hydroxyphthioceranic acid synthase-like n=1 Tax=Ptychodera flava TaxID=63121 RepID=UPI00396A8B79